MTGPATGPDHPVGRVALENGRPVLDAGLMAGLLGLDPDQLRTELRAGAITSLVERGEDSDAGRMRLTLRRGPQVVALRVDPDGQAFRIDPPAPEPALFRMIEALRSRSQP